MSIAHDAWHMGSLNQVLRVQLFATLGTVVCQVSLSMGFSRQEYWSGLPCPPPGDLPDPGIEPMSPALQVDSLPSEPLGKPSCFCECTLKRAQGRCTGTTLRDGIREEVGGGFTMGDTCTLMADSCECMAKTTTIL